MVCNRNRLLRLSLFLFVSLCRRFGLSGGIVFICLHRLHGVAVSMAMKTIKFQRISYEFPVN